MGHCDASNHHTRGCGLLPQPDRQPYDTSGLLQCPRINGTFRLHSSIEFLQTWIYLSCASTVNGRRPQFWGAASVLEFSQCSSIVPSGTTNMNSATVLNHHQALPFRGGGRWQDRHFPHLFHENLRFMKTRRQSFFVLKDHCLIYHESKTLLFAFKKSTRKQCPRMAGRLQIQRAVKQLLAVGNDEDDQYGIPQPIS